MQLLTCEETNLVSGSMTNAEWLGVGIGALGIGLGIAAAPVGVFGAIVATVVTFGGGVIIGGTSYHMMQ